MPTSRNWVRMGGAVVATAALVATGCERSTGQQAAPFGTVPPGSTAPTTAPAPAEPVRADERRPLRVSFLQRAESCERFAEKVRPIALEAVGPFGFQGGSGYAMDGMVASAPASAGLESTDRAAAPQAAAAPKAGVDFSGTNVQEAGVDEPDVVKTDGRLLVTAADGRLRVVDVSGAPRQVGVLEVPGGARDLLLVGNRVLVLSNSGSGGPLGPGVVEDRAGVSAPNRAWTSISVVDLADPAKPTIARTHTIDGAYVDARLIGGVARIVTRSTPQISFPQPVPDVQQGFDQTTTAKAQKVNEDVVRAAPPASFLPKGASCGDAYVPVESSGPGTVSVQSVDPMADAPGPAVTVVADASTVYASAGRLFVATNRFQSAGRLEAGKTATAPEQGRTAIHAFDITDPAKARYAGSGDVPGNVLNQFSLSEDDGVLRVATTLEGSGGFGGPIPLPADAPEASTQARSPAVQPVQQSQSRVSILRPVGEEWVETGAVDGLGKGERIYGVRFLGKTGYVVTFRQTDPLYVLDLRDVRKPAVTGELKITGYSAYLHPAGEARLLGLGQEATEQGRRQGTQLSLFDVGDPAAPKKLAGAVIAASSSSAEGDHRAFLYWPATGLVVAPVQAYDAGPNSKGGMPFAGAVAYRVGDTSITEAARITHPGSTMIERSLVVGDRLLTLSRVGLAVNDLKSLSDGGFVAFR